MSRKIIFGIIIAISLVFSFSFTCKSQDDFNLTQEEISRKWRAYGENSYNVYVGDKDGKTYMTYDAGGFSYTYRFDLGGKCEAFFEVYTIKELFIDEWLRSKSKFPYNSNTGKLQNDKGVTVKYDSKNLIISYFRSE